MVAALVMKILTIADPLSALHPESDTSLAILVAAKNAGHELWWCDSAHLSLMGSGTRITAQPITALTAKQLPALGSTEQFGVEAFDRICIRKNPPFDADYIRICWLLAPYEDRVRMTNRPSLLLRFHEKMVPHQAVQAGALTPDDVIPLCLSRDHDVVRAFMREHAAQAWVVKPWMGYAGMGVHKIEGEEAVLTALQASRHAMLVSPFLPEVTVTGDRRVFFLNGEVVGDIVRLPKPGGFVSNLALGGRGVLEPMDDVTRDRCTRLGAYLWEMGIVFAGGDVIDRKISEVNVTSPTGIVPFHDLGGEDLSVRILEAL
jgi:glutathione synthase